MQQYQLLGGMLAVMCSERALMGGGVAPSRRYGSRQNGPRWPRHSRRSRLIPLFLVLVAARLHIDVAVDVNAGLIHFEREIQRCCSDISCQYVGTTMQQYQLLSREPALMCSERSLNSADMVPIWNCNPFVE